MKRKVYFIASLLLALSIPMASFAHSGRTDKKGGHKDNKNASGLGSYHYHCGGNPPHLHTNGCPYGGSSSSGKSSSGSSSSSSKSSSSNSAKAQSTPKPVVVKPKIQAVDIPKKVVVGDYVKLSAKVYPEKEGNEKISWSTSTPEIADISYSGDLEALKAGTAIIKATTDSGLEAEFKIQVNEILAKSIEISKSKATVELDEKVELNVNFQPENTTDKTVTWKSDNLEIAEISDSGLLVGKKIGKTVVTAIHKDLESKIEIEVKPVEASRISLTVISDDEDEVRLKKGDEIKVTAEIYPENTTDKTLKWSVDNEEIAEVNKDGVVHGLKNGKVVVTATTTNGKKSSVELKVYDYTGLAVGGGFAAIATIIFGICKRKKNKL